MLLGMISENTKIRMVRIAEITPKYSAPNTFVASAPTPAAPIVCAIVFRQRMAEIGRSIFSLSFLSNFDPLAFSPSFIVTKEVGVESKTASRIEQVKEIAIAIVKYKITRPIKVK